MLNDRVLPFFEEQGIVVSRVLTDRGTEYCGNPQSHEYELYLAVENIDHTRTKARSPQTNGICERFNKTMLTEFYQVALRKKLYRSIDDLQADLDVWMRDYNSVRTHQGRWCYGKTPMQTFIDMLPRGKGKVAAGRMTSDSTDSSDTHHGENLTVRSSPYFYNLPASVVAQAWAEMQTRLSPRLQPHPLGALYGYAMEMPATPTVSDGSSVIHYTTIYKAFAR